MDWDWIYIYIYIWRISEEGHCSSVQAFRSHDKSRKQVNSDGELNVDCSFRVWLTKLQEIHQTYFRSKPNTKQKGMLHFFRPEKSPQIRPLASIDFTKNKSAKTVIKSKMIYLSGFVFTTLFNSPIDTEHVMEIRHSCLRIRIENKKQTTYKKTA